MIKPILLLTILLLLGQAGFSQRRDNSDSLGRELKRMATVVDSLRHQADHQDTIIESMQRMVDLLSRSSDSATNGLAGWRKTYNREMSRFDSTLQQLDSSLGALKKLSAQVEQLSKPKN